MISIKNNIMRLLLGVALFTACTDNLDIEKQNSVDLDKYYAQATDKDAESLMAAIYRSAYNTQNVIYLSQMNTMSDDGNTYSSLNVTSSDNPMSTYFTSYYNMNYACNLIIEKLSPSSDVKIQVIGEAYFWRAWAYLNLIRGWGNPPLVDHVLANSELQPANGATDELWDYVEQSLNEAISRLPEKAALGAQRAIGGRVTKGSAQALLGKARLLRGDYAGAQQVLSQLIASDKYALVSDFSDLYHQAADFCDEYMWEFNAYDDAPISTYIHEGDRRAVQLTWDTNGVTTPGGIQDMGTASLAEIDKNLYDFFVARGEKGKNRYMGTLWDYEDVLDRFVQLHLAANRTEAIRKFWKSSGVVSGQGYFRAKMLPRATDLYDYPTQNTDEIRVKANWPGMRYAEVLLMYAEACVKSGSQLPEGLAALNQVRRRAGLDAATSLTMQLVKDERRAELAFEGERFFDLVRWGDAATALKDCGKHTYLFYGYIKGTTRYNVKTTDTPNATGFINRDARFPYPYTELQLNHNLKQNPDW